MMQQSAVYFDAVNEQWVGERETTENGEPVRKTAWFETKRQAKEFARPRRWHVVLTDYGSISGQIEWDSDTIAEAASEIERAWGRWHHLPETDGAVLLSDALIARVYDTREITDAPAYELVPNEKAMRMRRQRPAY